MKGKHELPRYIYTHKDIHTGEIIYVGVGTGERAWEWRSNKRSKDHNELLESYLKEGYVPTDWAEVHSKGLTTEDAYALETELISLHKPKFNKLKNDDYVSPKWKFSEVHHFAKLLQKQGYSYSNIAYLLGGNESKSHTMSAWRMCNVY
jgi:hypothetical protein